jgi:hypothetical protein
MDAPPAPAGFPSTLPLTGWWRSSYSGSPWVGMASAGMSKGRDLAELTNAPVVSTALNGFTPAGFDGMNDKLGSSLPITSYVSPAAWEVHGIFSADSAIPYVAAVPYSFPALISSTGAVAFVSFYVAFSSAGVMAGHYDGATFKEVVSACGTGGLHAFQAWFDGATLNLIVDGGAPAAPVAAGPATFPVGTMVNVGANHNNTAMFDGRIVELLTSDKLLGAGGRAGVRAYFNTRYGTAFPL